MTIVNLYGYKKTFASILCFYILRGDKSSFTQIPEKGEMKGFPLFRNKHLAV